MNLNVALVRRRGTKYEAFVTFRGEGFIDLLGTQVRPCVFTPGSRLADALKDMWQDEGLLAAEIFNVTEAEEGLDDRVVGHDFVVSWTAVAPVYDEVL